jgi:hypothetical protein
VIYVVEADRMVLYTPIPLELVLAGTEPVRRYREAVIRGVPVLVEETAPGRGRVVRLLSTDPFDYLAPGLAPGTEVNFS